ncbi:MAG: DUF1501 domain-containing protein [Putridiphycobacter sp.]|nr:DUF1501 domain-containing protein [Putridiphycobacter sp.]
MKEKMTQSRRRFIKAASLAALGLSAPASAMVQLKALNALMSAPPVLPFGNYKALVFVFLHGGNDSYNMLAPKSNTEYGHYATTRSNLAIPQNDLLGISSNDYGLHPSLAGMQQLFNNGDAAMLANIGTLIEPTTVAQYQNGSVPIPLGLFSHLDQYNHWQTAHPHMRTNKGWGGQIADLIGATNVNQNISMNISLAGSNLFQYGNNTVEFSMNKNGPELPFYYYDTWGNNEARRELTDSLLYHNYQDPFKKTYADTFKQSLEAGIEFKQAIDALPPFTTNFSSSNISQELEMVAKTIAARNTLGFERQIFFVRHGGWDHHDDLLSRQASAMTQIDNAMVEFKSALDELGMFNDVTTFVGSEFARTLTSNGNGSDHAWGGNAMVMGGDVLGNQIYGTYPTLQIGGPQYLDGGVVVPTTATDSLFAELALWYGLTPSDLPTIFPNLGNFHNLSTLSTSNPPIGFLTM